MGAAFATGCVGLEVLTPDEMGEADRLAGASISSWALMENAGRAAARFAARRYGPCRTLVLCGPGNNGGDGYVIARLLAARGWPVTVAAWKLPRDGTDAARARAGWRGAVHDVGAVDPARFALVVDALFGAGLRHPLEDALAATLARAPRVLAIDLPSGLDGRTGAGRGAVRAADATVTFFRPKPGHLLEPGRSLCGTLAVLAIGLPPAVLGSIPVRTWWNRPGLFRLRAAAADDHKYARGVVSVVGGSVMAGAARLAAEAARRAGAGLVRIAAPAELGAYRAVEPGVIVDAGPIAPMLEDRRRAVWVCGPGLDAAEAGDALAVLLGAGDRSVVADAGSFGWARGAPERLRGAAVLTPHEGEFAAVFGPVGDDRIAAARTAATRTGAIVLLKGATTIVAAPDGRVAINTHATPALATAGSGDTLAGIVGAMLGNGLAPFETAAAAAWLHGEAGLQAGAGLLAEDLAPLLPAALARASALEGAGDAG